MTNDDILGVERNFASLSTRDLLEARDLYHWHLIHKPNVVGTAIGLYRIRKSDPWPSEYRSDASEARAQQAKPKGERTFEDSEIRDYSWPCVLVFVDRWRSPSDFAVEKGSSPDQMVPKTLYMPDGRMVPVCVLKITRSRRITPCFLHGTGRTTSSAAAFPSSVRRRVNRAWPVSEDWSPTAIWSTRSPAGTSLAPRAILSAASSAATIPTSACRATSSSLAFRFPRCTRSFRADGRFSRWTLDSLPLRRFRDWTSQVYGLPPVGTLADLSERNISTRLINADVRAYGAATGHWWSHRGALLPPSKHRRLRRCHRFLDRARAGNAALAARDSGTIWHFVQKDGVLRPLALQWGGQGFIAGADGGVFNFALGREPDQRAAPVRCRAGRRP